MRRILFGLSCAAAMVAIVLTVPPLEAQVRKIANAVLGPTGALVVSAGSVASSVPVAIGTNPADAGAVRLANTEVIRARNAANSANIRLLATGIGGVDTIDIGEGGYNVNIFGTPVVVHGGLVTNSATAGMGYGTGAGGTVTQGAGSGKATALTLNFVSGAITMDAASLAADTAVSFTWTNSAIAATDKVLVNITGGTAAAYNWTVACGAGSATVTVRNVTTGALAEAIVLNFNLFKGVSS